jgi:hypothetical protein
LQLQPLEGLIHVVICSLPQLGFYVRLIGLDGIIVGETNLRFERCIKGGSYERVPERLAKRDAGNAEGDGTSIGLPRQLKTALSAF